MGNIANGIAVEKNLPQSIRCAFMGDADYEQLFHPTDGDSRIQKASTVLPYWEEADIIQIGKASAMQVNTVSLVPSRRWTFFSSWAEPGQSTEVRGQSRKAVAQSSGQRVTELSGLRIRGYNAVQSAPSRSPPAPRKRPMGC